ncbi:MAG TPA: FtsX-like permease family protein [Desulfuromonadales bacterium]|nr:FtsX-like permease family protein [Desulfuromonadales bacterium]
MDLFRLAWKNLWRSRRRTLITLAAIGLSVMLVQAFHNLAFGTYARMIDSGVRAGSGHIAIYHEGYVESRDETLSFEPQGLVETVRDLPKVEEALPRLYLPGLAQSSRESRGIMLTGVHPEAERRVNPFIKDLPEDEMVRDLEGRDAVIGQRLLDELKIRQGGKFVITVQSRSGELVSELFRVRGVVETGIKDIDRSLVMVGLDRAAAMNGRPGEISELAVILDEPEADRSVHPLLEKLTADRPHLDVLSWEKAMPNLANAIKLDYASQKVIFAIIVLIVTIGVVNTLLMSVMERFHEFGVILALGASPGKLRRMVLAEALLLGLVAMVFGCVLGTLGTWYLAEVGIDLRTFISEDLEFGGVVFEPVLKAGWDVVWMVQIALYVVFLSVLASLYPAVKAGRIVPAEAMRHF